MADLLDVAADHFDAIIAANIGQFGQAITHYPAGVIANAAPVQGSLQIADAEKSDDKGRLIVTRGRLYIGDDVVVAESDRWLVDGVTWNTEANGKPAAGLRIVQVVTAENISRTSGGRNNGGR